MPFPGILISPYKKPANRSDPNDLYEFCTVAGPENLVQLGWSEANLEGEADAGFGVLFTEDAAAEREADARVLEREGEAGAERVVVRVAAGDVLALVVPEDGAAEDATGEERRDRLAADLEHDA